MFANCSSGGMNFAMPDVCLTPAGPAMVPIPYPNTAQLPMAVGFNPKHFINMMPAHTLSTQVPMSMGDNAGVGGGVASGMIMGPSKHIKGSVKVFSGGMPQTRSTVDPTIQNMTNAPGGMTMVPSQFKVMIMS